MLPIRTRAAKPMHHRCLCRISRHALTALHSAFTFHAAYAQRVARYAFGRWGSCVVCDDAVVYVAWRVGRVGSAAWPAAHEPQGAQVVTYKGHQKAVVCVALSDPPDST